MADDRWGVPRVRQLAPDQRSFAAAQRLARSGVWSDVGQLDALLWGRCQGSGSTPYQVTVDTAGPTVQCTCPSRKQPCKHGLALLLRWVAEGEDLGTGQSPAGVARRGAVGAGQGQDDGAGHGQDAREGRAPDAREGQAPDAREGRAPDAREGQAPVDPAAQAKRRERRIALMDAGMVELDRWLTDLVTDGLATVRSRPHEWWDRTAARLVDAQMPGLADRVRSTGQRIAGDEQWASTLLTEVGRWHLTAQAWQARDTLTEDDAADLRTFLGWSRTADEVMAGRRRTGRWTVVGVGTSHSGRLTEQRTWLTHPEEGLVTMLDFAAGGAAPPVARLVGAVLEGTAAVYPGAPPRRIRFVDDPVDAGRVEALDGATLGWDRALADLAAVMAAAPWQDRFGVVVAGVRLTDVDTTPQLVDSAGDAMPVVGIDGVGMLAQTGGQPVTVFTEVVDGTCRPLSMVTDDHLVTVAAPPEPTGWWAGG